jgi:hypothetical protein
MPTHKLTPEIINAAILGFEQQKLEIDAEIAELRTLLPGGLASPAATPDAAPRKRRKFSAAARRRMKEAQQRRWAKIKGESEPSMPATPEPPKPKRKVSAAGMAAIIAATKRRWAKVNGLSLRRCSTRVGSNVWTGTVRYSSWPWASFTT